MLLMFFSACSREEKKISVSFVTRWEMRPSFKYDLCSFIGIMTGREYYVRYYPELYAEWKKRLTPAASRALKTINEIIGPDTPPGPRLCLFFSTLPDEGDSLSAILYFMENLSWLPHASPVAAHGNAVDNQQWQALRPHLRIFLEFLQREKFERYWRARLLPAINKQAPRFRQELQAFDVIGDLERFLVDGNYSDTIYVYLVRLIQPHALRLPGQRYVSDTSYPVHVTVKSAYHEIVHPYADRLVDSVLAEQFKRLEQDSFLQLIVARIDQATAYKSFKAFFHEEVTLAADLWMAERRRMISQIMNTAGVHPSAAVRSYLAEHDEGRHVLAAVIYSYLAEGLKKDDETYAEFMRMLFASRRLVPGKIEERYNKVMNVQ
jgi:hypothetical protein